MPATPKEAHHRGFIIPIGGAERRSRKSGILSRFARLCGGKDARIMVIPTASRRDETENKIGRGSSRSLSPPSKAGAVVVT